MNTRLKQLTTVAALMAATVMAAQQPFQLDPSFHTTIQAQTIGGILERPDGKIIISGWMYYPTALDLKLGGLLEPNGNWVPDPNAPSSWYGPMGGKIVPWGTDSFYVGNGQGIRRFALDGTMDYTFQNPPDPKLGGGQGGDFHVFPDGRVLETGNYDLYDTLRGFVGPGYGLVWLNTDGSLDTTRVHRYITPWGVILRIAQLADGKLIAGGRIPEFDGTPVPSIVYRIEPDGSLDTTFHGPVTTYGYVDYFHQEPSGKILMTGTFCFEGSPDTLGLVRLLPDGQLDPTFNNQHRFSTSYFHDRNVGTRQVKPIGTDMYAVTGDFDRIDGETRGGIAMLDTAGNLLPGYFEGSGCGGFYWPPLNPGQYPYQFIVGIKEAMDGSYYIYGSYRGFDDGVTNGTNQRLISRLYGLNVGIQEHAAPRPLTIAPNPASGAVQLSVGAAPVGATLYVHDASGRVVLQEPWPAGAYTHTLQAGVLAPGVYVLRVAAQPPLSSAALGLTGAAPGLTGAAPAVASRASATADAPPLYTGRLVVVP